VLLPRAITNCKCMACSRHDAWSTIDTRFFRNLYIHILSCSWLDADFYMRKPKKPHRLQKYNCIAPPTTNHQNSATRGHKRLLKPQFETCTCVFSLPNPKCKRRFPNAPMPSFMFVQTWAQINQSKRMVGDWGADRASASSAALESDRYAVHAIPTVDTNGCDEH
jgi:hypothetical protein